MENMKKKFEVIESITLDKVMQKNLNAFVVCLERNYRDYGTSIAIICATEGFNGLDLHSYRTNSGIHKVWKYYVALAPWCSRMFSNIISPLAYQYITIKKLKNEFGHQFYRADIDYKRFEKDYKLLKF